MLGIIFTSVASVRVTFVLRTCPGWDWCYEAVAGSSPCSKCQEEIQTGVNHIPAQSMVCSLSDMGAVHVPSAAASSSLVLTPLQAPHDVYGPP